ncbi:isoprenylcysteine carboxylmethyltransferase family protein [Methylomicrobium sp. Wu6]|uniref:isoprenylcysteine carboxylmethyltransferase family protein n=1 Tax=Methylomicrobium sp. Wu6 TaxID=3107928 RepID=UPI002DD66F65|nr:isoprenylcysteine carboxylmethyltransferase family protein [Methylomicrobium sp. Wu6]MEC4746989.1 isoprenylcysteine carboxylmethyltransferase family protein [Methylomicrobium sp. Wu6]
MNNERLAQQKLGRTAYVLLWLAFLVISAMLFLSAGTVRYWEAWVYLAIMLITTSLIVQYLLKNSPGLLERRMRMREKEPQQRWIIGFAWFWFVVTFLTPGFDQRSTASDVPTVLVAIADIIVLMGYCVIFWVFRENPYASRVVEVESDQRVISTGPYAMVRHPMYFGGILVYLATPLALGSYWALLPAVFIIPILVARIRNEESILARDLKGYRDYLKSTRYRLFPGIW